VPRKIEKNRGKSLGTGEKRLDQADGRKKKKKKKKKKEKKKKKKNKKKLLTAAKRGKT